MTGGSENRVRSARERAAKARARIEAAEKARLDAEQARVEAERAVAEAEADAEAEAAEAEADRAEADAVRAEARGTDSAATDFRPVAVDLPGDDSGTDDSTTDESHTDDSADPQDGEDVREAGFHPVAGFEDGVQRGKRDRRRLALVGAASLVVVALIAGTAFMVVLVSRGQSEDALRAEYINAASQGVLNLTTISSADAESDVQRVLEASTGKFREDFGGRSEAFVAVVKSAEVTTTGNIDLAALESVSGDGSAVALVAATSEVTNAAGAKQEPRVWRLRVSLQRVDDRILMSDVEFVP